MRRRRFPPLGIVTVPLLLLAAGCNYVHFGRLDRFKNDAALAAENSDLRIEKKLLQQELAIAHKEREVLRTAVEHQPEPNAVGSEELAAKLKATTAELSELRASYARLQADRERARPVTTPNTNTAAGRVAAAEQIAALRSKLGETEDRLADALRNYTQLQAETQQLRTSVDETHRENASLAQKLDVVTAQNNEARSALAQLNTEFLAQKEARAQAEQAAEALRTQLHAIADHGASNPTASLAAARESSAAGVRAIESPVAAPGLDASVAVDAMLSTSPAKLRAGSAAAAPGAPVPTPVRTYVVEEGDSLEKISQKFYGRPDRWSLLYSANNAQLSGDRPLAAGMILQIPED